MLFEVFTDSINFKFITRTGLIIDNYTIIKPISALVEDNLESICIFHL